jgi:hypothetical protein
VVAGRDRDRSEAEIKTGSNKVAPIRADRLPLQAPQRESLSGQMTLDPIFQGAPGWKKKSLIFSYLFWCGTLRAPTGIPLSGD